MGDEEGCMESEGIDEAFRARYGLLRGTSLIATRPRSSGARRSGKMPFKLLQYGHG